MGADRTVDLVGPGIRVAEIAVQQPVPHTRGPVEIAVDRTWRFFCSVRAAIWEVAILAVLVLIGTLRGSEVPQWIADLIPPAQGLVDRWYRWDVFKSLPFAFLLGLLAVAITVCTINRAPGLWQSIAQPTVTTTHGFIRSAEISMETASQSSQRELTAQIESALRSRKYRVLSQEHNGETHIYGDRFRFGKLGTFPFHLALIMILVGGIIGARYGFRDNRFVVPEKAMAEVGHGTGLSVYLEEFQDSYNELGQAVEYRSDLVLYENGDEVKRQSITVNNPMTYGSTIFYQSSFGPAVVIKIADRGGNVLFEGPLALAVDFTARDNPDAPAGVVDLLPLNKRVYVITPDADPRNAPELDRLNLRSGEIFVQVRDLGAEPDPNVMPPSAVVSQGDPTAVDELTVTFVRESQWSLLQVARNPAIPIFWAATLLMIGGLAIVFYFPHRRIRAIVSSTPSGGSTAAMAPMAKRDWSARRVFEQLAMSINRQFDGAWTIRERGQGLQSERATGEAGAG
jgi:cytochrome c biogenesis protein